MKNCLFLVLFLLNAVVTLAQPAIIGIGKEINPYNYSSIKQKEYSKNAVASAHPLASMVGAAIMQHGGNAFDAAIAVQLALAVVYPGAGNIGGGGFMLARNMDGKYLALDFRETAPAKASRDMYLDSKGNVVTSLSLDGHLSAGIPGTVAGLFATMKYAKLSFKTLIQPAIDLAELGYVITEKEAANLNTNQSLFIKCNTKPNVFIKAWKGGDTLVQKELAATLKRIRDKGAKGFYEGKTAAFIVDEMKRGKGIVTLDDLKNYTVKFRTPIQFDYRGHTIISMPPPSSGGIILLQMMKMIEDKNIETYGFQTARSVQLMVEAERRAYADRATYLGDPDFWKVPMKTLSSNSYILDRMKDYNSGKATPSKNIGAGTIKESEETTHISIMDEWGNMVSITTTLNGSYGSKTVVGGAGFLLNNEMDDFSAKPGEPNAYGAIGGEANAIAPNKRMLSSMTPALVLKNNAPFMVVGSPGGTTIPTSVFQTLVNVIDFYMNLDDAINKPKFHHQWLPDEVFVEKNFPKNIRNELTVMGYRVTERVPIGRVEAIQVLDSGKKQTVADGRGDDGVAGW